jgi:hypothetical protein
VSRTRVGLLALALFGLACSTGLRRFADRPVAWHEHDDEHVPEPPARSSVGATRFAVGLLDLLLREVDRALSIEWRRPADDVNAADEVPCSTWFCPRNHLGERLTPEAVAAGPPWATAPELPLTITAGDESGVERGFDVVDGAGRRYRLRFDPPGHPRLATSAEAVAHRLLYAAGWNTTGAFALGLRAEDLPIAHGTTILRRGYLEVPFTAADLHVMLAAAARSADGRIPAVAVAQPPGEPLGAFDFTGRRDDDPNDRIPHQHRRSLRASLVAAAWIGAASLSASDTVDVWVAEGGRRFVRHHFRDLSATFGASWTDPKGPWLGEERIFSPSRVVRALFLLGAYRRPWQDDRDRWREVLRASPAVGWYEGVGWSPQEFHTVFPLPAHVRMTDRDAYWGAKVVSAFSDRQILAAVGAGGYTPEEAARLAATLRIRRDAIARAFLPPVTAIEDVSLSPDGRELCFRDLAIERAAVAVDQVRYGVGIGGPRRFVAAQDLRSCLPLPALPRDYVVVTVVSQVRGVLARAARAHLAWRAAAGTHALVGLERDE